MPRPFWVGGRGVESDGSIGLAAGLTCVCCFRIRDDVDLHFSGSTSCCCGEGIRTRADVRGEHEGGDCGDLTVPFGIRNVTGVPRSNPRGFGCGLVCLGLFYSTIDDSMATMGYTMKG